MAQKLTLPIKSLNGSNRLNGKKAQVHCVIIGFSGYKKSKEKKIFGLKGFKEVEHINPYLVDAKDALVSSRKHPICNAPEMVYGNKPTDGGFLLLNEMEKEELVKENALAKKWIRPFMGAEEFLNGKKRWCLWLVDASPHKLRKCKSIMKRIEKVKNFRLNSKKSATQKLASVPTLFDEIRHPHSDYLIIPVVSSGNRKYIPMAFVDKNVIASNATLIIPNATLYDFGILTSSVHMAWTKAVCGYYGPSCIYSSSIVYNNFIWANPTPAQKEKIEKAAQAVLDARKLYPESTLADLYNPNTMPFELAKAHEELDSAVKAAYGDKGFETEEEIVASLMKLYKEKQQETGQGTQ